MSVQLIWEQSDGSVVKGIRECEVQSVTQKDFVDSDLNHGVLRPGDTSVPQVITVKTFSWQRNGDPLNAITNAGIFLASYYTSDPTYTADTGFSFCGGADTATFGDYNDANGSASAAANLSALQGFGDAGTGGIQISLDRGRTYTTFTSSTGTLDNPILLSASAMDIGTVDGQLEPGDRATIFARVQIPSTYTSPANAGVWLFNLGMFYNFTE